MLLSCRDISKSYGNLQVLKGISFDIEEGEFITILGKSGAGKSTLLHLIGTLDNSDHGIILFDGMDLSQLSKTKLDEFRNQQIGFVFQFHHLLPEFSATENVALAAMIGGDSAQLARKKANKLLTRLGLGERLTHKPGQLSGGEQQRVAIARALVNEPRMVLADEPTGNLDTQTSREIHELIKELQQELNLTFIIVTHNTELAALSDRSLHMVDGLLL
jgi:lipoprotein-releasing system ATP-binding protein